VQANLHSQLEKLCLRAATERQLVRVTDFAQAASWLGDLRELASLDCKLLVAAPIARAERVIGAIVLLFTNRPRLDEALASFIETACNLIGVGSLFDNTADVARLAQQEPNQHTTTGIVLLGPSVAHQLDGPVAALDLQLDEQRRLLAELRAVTDAGDNVVWGTVSELAELTDEIAAAVSRIRETTQQLSQLGSRSQSRGVFDMAQIAQEAVAVLRPALEARGVVIETQLSAGCETRIQRDAVMQVALDLITIAAELGESTVVRPHVAIHTSQEGDRVILSIDDTGPGLDDVALRNIHDHPFSGSIPDGRRRLVLRLAGDVAAAHGGYLEVLNRDDGAGSSYRLVLPSLNSSTRTQSNIPFVSTNADAPQTNVHDVLIVDDDPIFSRSARRALRPHRVHESATASEAAFQLLQPRYTPSLVVCDLMLPGSDGTDLHARVRDVRPELARRFLFVTGGTLSKSTADYIRGSGCYAFQKPFDFTRLRRHLSRCSAEDVATDPVVSLQVHLFKPIHP
jgi:signal transduction histidine kinase/ActR/RegA family two-component response regulator